jgi:hypothetical protein
VTNKKKRQYRIRNWRDHNSALVRRGSLTLSVAQGAVNRWLDTAAPRRGGSASTPTPDNSNVLLMVKSPVQPRLPKAEDAD